VFVRSQPAPTATSPVKSILQNGLDAVALPAPPAPPAVPDHDNVRGPDYYC